MQIACVIGTRPEAVKLSPVLDLLRRGGSPFRVTIVNSGQHLEEVAEALAQFDLSVDETLTDSRGQSLGDMTAALIAQLGRAPSIRRAGLVLVQGDTTTAFAGGLAAFHQGIPVAHLEAGLRSGIPDRPFPEEAHRRLLAVLATIHLAPTEQARANLRAMGVARGQIAVTGNTSVDALRRVAGASPSEARSVLGLDARRIVLMTLHRRESWNGALARICDGVVAAVRDVPDTVIVFPLHRNPRVREVVVARLGGMARVQLLEALPYRQFVTHLQAADVVVTDSGGVQEEAASLGKQTLIVREVTDRPEAVEAGVARLVGTSSADVSRALRSALRRASSNVFTDVYGDGGAAARVVLALNRWREGQRPLLPRELEFRSMAAADRLAVG
jgi:UDP-N-acetylglucosamine 2-epimerase (non-hydrolysing)